MKRASLLLLLLVGGAHAGDWPQWRGPGSTGVAEGDGYPVRWSATENVRWKASLPGRGLSGPVVVAERVYLTASSGPTQDRLHVLCFDTASGRQVWHKQFWASGNTISHPKTCMAAATPVAVGDRVFALFATGDLFCLDKDGLLLWCRTLTQDYPDVTNHLGMASSPVLAGNTLIVTLESPGDSLVLGLDASNGRNRWKVKRPPDANWTTPLLWDRGGRREVVLQSASKLSGHDPETGKEQWSFAGEELAKIPSPVAGPGLLLTPSRETLLAIRPAENTTELVWKSAKLRPATATPLVHRDRVYAVNSPGILTCADAVTGESLWQERVKGPSSASPVLAGNRIYVVSEEGVTTVVELGDKGKVLASNVLGEAILATPALANGAIYLRSDAHLFCIAEKP